MEQNEKLKWADSHAHLNHPDFAGDLERMAEQLAEEDFLLLNVAYDIEAGEKAIELARRYPNMKASIGIHPHDAHGVTGDDIKRIRELAEDENVVAVGETGLDYFRNKSPEEDQKKALKAHLKIASEVKKPVIIHCREAFPDIVPIFEEYFDKEAGGVLHCFSEGPDEARRGLELGFYVSFAGNSTYKKAQSLRDAAKVVPAERLLIETDCPYLSPQPMRGKRNEPLFVAETARVLAEERGVTLEDLARGTRANYQRLFLKKKPEKAEITYRIRNTVYINVTRACNNRCIFCPREDAPYVQGHFLGVETDPSPEEILKELEGWKGEVVFCGFGEPTLRLEAVKEVAAELKKRGNRTRLNTNGQGSLANRRNIVPELKGLIDVVSVSLDAPDRDTYNRVCVPSNPEKAFDSILDFIKTCREEGLETVASAVDLPEGVDLTATRKLAEETLGVPFRLRAYNMVG